MEFLLLVVDIHGMYGTACMMFSCVIHELHFINNDYELTGSMPDQFSVRPGMSQVRFTKAKIIVIWLVNKVLVDTRTKKRKKDISSRISKKSFTNSNQNH